VTQSPNSACTTRGLVVEAAAQYLPAESDPERRQHFYVYRIRMTNEGDRRLRLLTRHWVIIDAHNQREEVRGPGVVGKHPELGPGESFSYTSYCPLRTEWGTMEGSFIFRDEDGETVRAEVGRFFLVPAVDNELVPR